MVPKWTYGAAAVFSMRCLLAKQRLTLSETNKFACSSFNVNFPFFVGRMSRTGRRLYSEKFGGLIMTST
jgi:hypothetical protein